MKKILLINWDNYPNTAVGGIYSWARDLIEGLPQNEFVVLNWNSNPNTNGKLVVPQNVTKVINIPLFGAFRAEEFSDDDNDMMYKISNTSSSVIESEFLPMYRNLIHGLLANHYDHNKVQQTILDINHFMLK